MKLYEFFGSWQAKAPMDVDNPMDKNGDGTITHEEKEQFKNDLFFYILDNDDLYKKNFYQIAEEIHSTKDCPENVWIPMVNRGCMEYYRENKLTDDPKDLFTKEFREDICKLLDDHYRKDILKGVYQ